MLTATMVKEKAREFGIDLVGIADINLFDGTAPERDPRFIAPAAKRIIGLGFRVLRGAFRGIEEGTQYYQLMEMGMLSMDERFIPMSLRRLACFIEDQGYEAAVQRSNPDRRPASDPGANPEVMKTAKLHAVPAAPGKPAPDVRLDFNQAAVLTGLGIMGQGGFILTPEFGPFQRFAFILTDAELETDPLCERHDLCDRCGKCAAGCPGHAITADPATEHWAGQKVEHLALNEWQCYAYHCGAHSATNPFLPPDAFKDFPDGDKIVRGEIQLDAATAVKVAERARRFYYGSGLYNPCMCGKSCQRECFIHLEERGILTRKFKHRLRPGEAWRIADKPRQSYAETSYGGK